MQAVLPPTSPLHIAVTKMFKCSQKEGLFVGVKYHVRIKRRKILDKEFPWAITFNFSSFYGTGYDS